MNNILAVQEVAHSIEHDFKDSCRMIVKNNVKKSYAILSWNAVFANLIKMDFPPI